MMHGDFETNTTEKLPDIGNRRGGAHNEYNSVDLQGITPNIASAKQSISYLRNREANALDSSFIDVR